VGGITGLSVERKFQSPSIAIVNACGAAAAGAASFINQLHLAGFEAIVGTALTVDPVMAGQYVHELVGALRARGEARNYTLSAAHDDAVRSLMKTYGPRALLYTLVGNGSLRLCAADKP
jgi:hypothetical protein